MLTVSTLLLLVILAHEPLHQVPERTECHQLKHELREEFVVAITHGTRIGIGETRSDETLNRRHNLASFTYSERDLGIRHNQQEFLVVRVLTERSCRHHVPIFTPTLGGRMGKSTWPKRNRDCDVVWNCDLRHENTHGFPVMRPSRLVASHACVDVFLDRARELTKRSVHELRQCVYGSRERCLVLFHECRVNPAIAGCHGDEFTHPNGHFHVQYLARPVQSEFNVGRKRGAGESTSSLGSLGHYELNTTRLRVDESGQLLLGGGEYRIWRDRGRFRFEFVLVDFAKLFGIDTRGGNWIRTASEHEKKACQNYVSHEEFTAKVFAYELTVCGFDGKNARCRAEWSRLGTQIPLQLSLWETNVLKPYIGTRLPIQSYLRFFARGPPLLVNAIPSLRVTRTKKPRFALAG